MLRIMSVTRRSLTTLALIPALATVALTAACGKDEALDVPSNPAVEVYAASVGVNIASMTKKSDALYVQDLVVGTGAEVVAGKTITVKYSGWLINGTPFDSGTLPNLVIGTGRVITGWDLGIPGMKVGGKRKLVIGSALGYGRTGSGPIPANATMVFDVEVLSMQ